MHACMVTIDMLGPREWLEDLGEKAEKAERMALGCFESPLLRRDGMLEPEKGGIFQTFTNSEGI